MIRFACLILLLLVTSAAQGGEWHGRARVIDGDTLEITHQRVRLKGIDAPERGQMCRRNGLEYDCGSEAIGAIIDVMRSREVFCSGSQRDRHHLPLVDCHIEVELAKGPIAMPGPPLGPRRTAKINLNAEMVKIGWAVSYGSRDYIEQETYARRRRFGMWEGEFERPADWRKKHQR